jgi:tRNA-splicing ligase RtcB
MVALVIHSGSRHLGKQIAEYYQDLAYKTLVSARKERDRIIAELKAEGREKEIQKALQEMKRLDIPKDLAYLEGENFQAYMHDMKIAQLFAFYNRKAMTDIILKWMGWEVHRNFTTIHNYIDMENMILRKGAISAQEGEEVIIPINMRDGSIIAVGKGNPDWNYSGPHGAGRIMSRAQARKAIKLNEFQKSMKGIYTTSVNKRTIDEAPMVYKPIKEIIKHTEETITIKQIIKPVYNFKAN